MVDNVKYHQIFSSWYTLSKKFVKIKKKLVILCTLYTQIIVMTDVVRFCITEGVCARAPNYALFKIKIRKQNVWKISI